ncbi:hypothetical protein DFP73DRAFT_526105 [Morchella snyderi]|nr:hypothetical protein DFP73DRAFT_526105 [Morchella snyderi]
MYLLAPSHLLAHTPRPPTDLVSNGFTKNRFSKKLASFVERAKNFIKKPFKKSTWRSKTSRVGPLKTFPREFRDQVPAQATLIIMGAGILDPVFFFFCTYPYRYSPVGQMFERVSRFTEHFE